MTVIKGGAAADTIGFSETVVLQVGRGGAFTLKVVESREEKLVGREYRLEAGCTIGRSDECDVVVPDTSVSRRHARIEWTGEAWRLADQKSANGTWIGDRRVEETLLDDLDRFRVGNTVLEFAREAKGDADDLRMAVTTSVPVKEILESIRLQLSVPLEEEGEPVVVAGNKPFFLDDPAALWLVVEGKLDVFTVAMKDGEPAGARSHFTTVETGSALFGMDLAGYGLGSGFLASGRTGTRLRKIAVARLAELAGAGKHVARIAALLDGWIAALGKALVKDMPAGAIDADLEPGAEAALGFGKRARARKDVAWVAGEGFLFISLSEVSAGGRPLLFPVGPEAWIESTEDGTALAPVASVSALADPALWRGLGVFHQVLCECEFINKKLATVDEYNRLKSKAEHAEEAKAAAMRDIGDVLATAGSRVREAAEAGDVEPVYQACRHVCAALGMTAKKPPEARAERSFEDALYAVSVASRFRTRQVALRADWWRHDHGPLLGRLEATKEPVALVPTSPRTYECIEGKTGKRTPVDAELGATLHPFAYSFYRRFPDGPLAAKQILKFGAYGLKRDALTLVAMGVALGVLGSMTPYFTGRMFDSAIPQADRSLLVQFTLALFVSALASSAFKLTQSVAVLRVQGKMDYSVQSALWDRLLDLPSTFFRQFTSGDLADRAGGIDAIRQLLAGAGIGAILGSLSSIFYVVLMLKYSVPLALVGILLTLIFVAFSTTANILQLRAQRTQLQMNGRITGLVLQLISGVGKLRVSGAEHHGFRVWARQFSEQKRLAIRAGIIQNAVAVFNSSFPILASMAIFATLVSAQSKAAAAGSAAPGITTGEFIAFNAAFGLFLAAMQALSEASLSLLRAVPIWERLLPILETLPETDESKSAPGTLKGEIDISHVSFRYGEDGPYILRDLSLKIRPGEFVAFVGGSGCGKSTLMRLMLGFEKPEKGSIYYDGQDLAGLDLRLVRQQLGVVLQESRVLPSDIYRNIVGTSSRTIDEAWEAAEAAGFAADIRQMPMGIHTYVSEGGGGFSGGQRQRLMIARAIVNKPKILFLDEATSALDNKTQAIVTASMDKMRSTRIVIAHRLSTIVNADRICYLQGGQIAEMGTYDELMKKDGLFAELARRQMA